MYLLLQSRSWLHGDPDLSNVVGISSDRVILWAFGIGSALAAVAGILIAFDTDMRPTMGFSGSLVAVRRGGNDYRRGR